MDRTLALTSIRIASESETKTGSVRCPPTPMSKRVMVVGFKRQDETINFISFHEEYPERRRDRDRPNDVDDGTNLPPSNIISHPSHYILIQRIQQ